MKIEKFVLNKDTLPPLTTDTLRWQKFTVMGYEGVAQAQSMSGNINYCSIKLDSFSGGWVITSYQDSTFAGKIYFTQTDSTHVDLKGTWKGDSIWMHTRRKLDKDYPLMKRGFHWVNEYPMNW